MNDADIELISALVAGDLSPDEEAAALTRIESDTELRAAYGEQLAVASLLRAAPAVAMTTDERSALHGALRRELRLDETPVATAPSQGRSRWWIALGGLATAAIAVFAFAIVPDIMDGGDLVSAPSSETTAANLDTLSDGEALLESTAVPTTAAGDGAGVDTSDPTAADESPSTAAPEPEESATTDTTEPSTSEPVYYLSPVVARASVFDLPVLDAAVIAAAGLEAAIAEATVFIPFEIAGLIACFTGEPGSGDRAFAPAGVTADASAVYGTATDVASGDSETLMVALDTCEITKAG